MTADQAEADRELAKRLRRSLQPADELPEQLPLGLAPDTAAPDDVLTWTMTARAARRLAAVLGFAGLRTRDDLLTALQAAAAEFEAE